MGDKHFNCLNRIAYMFVTRSFVLCVCFVDNCLFYLAIVLSVLLRRILITLLVYSNSSIVLTSFNGKVMTST
jgi:hypothetical protein